MKNRLALIVLVTFALFTAGNLHAAPIGLTHSVSGTDNLYYDDWGHTWNQPFEALRQLDKWWDANPEPYGRDAGQRATAVASGGMAFNFAGLGAGFVEISASGYVQDNGPWWTAPDGDDWLFRNLWVYSLIGIWSSTADVIAPLPGMEPFFVGRAALLDIPLWQGAAYLFLANNDGWFFDNDGAYDVSLRAWAVPEPATLALLAILLGAILIRRRRDGVTQVRPVG